MIGFTFSDDVVESHEVNDNTNQPNEVGGDALNTDSERPAVLASLMADLTASPAKLFNKNRGTTSGFALPLAMLVS